MFKKLKRNLILFLTLTLLTVSAAPAFTANAESSAAVLTATLTDGATVKSAKKNFFVISKDENGNKVTPTAALNGQNIAPTWDDNSQTSFTLEFTEEGENTVTVTNGYITLTYTLIYQRAEVGELIGYATWSVEMLTLGNGFLIEPIRFPVYEGENAAQVLIKLLEEYEYSCNHTGEPESGFYLAAINGVDHPASLSECAVPEPLMEKLEENGISDGDASGSSLGEFDYTYMAGWMYSVNNNFPNVGFSNTYLSDGDVVRVQFTLCGYGADIGGGYSMGGGVTTDFYPVANKTRLLTAISEINSSPQKYQTAMKTIQADFNAACDQAEDLLAAQEDVDAATEALISAVAALQKPYDVNGDGKINILDMIVLKKITVNRHAETLNSDINSDGNHDATDITLLRKKLLAA